MWAAANDISSPPTAQMFQGAIASRSYLLAAFFYSLVGLGSAGSYNAALTTNVRNWNAKDHGFVVGTSVSFFGLSAFIFSQLSYIFYREDADSNPHSTVPHHSAMDTHGFLLFLAFTTGGVNLLAMFCLTDLSREPGMRMTHFGDGDNSTSSLLSNDASSARSSSSHLDDRDEEENGSESVRARPKADLSFFTNVDAWVLFAAFGLLVGTGLMYINNIGAIVVALSSAPSDSPPVSRTQSTQVSLISIFNCIGRIVTGIASDYAKRVAGIRRDVFLIGAASLFLISQLIATRVASIALLHVCTVLVGFAYGSLFSSAPVIVGNWFGIKKFGTHWGWFQWAPALGGQVFNLTFGAIADAHRPSDPEKECKGSDCFSLAFVFTAGACCVSLALLAVLYRRRRRLVSYTVVPHAS
ncbi:hypothetical protein HK104_001289 [Borealophlyctis nickersoniae]|nr:hypothetical protein HK104_001289 [Borealophlyctis nickersoniae]